MDGGRLALKFFNLDEEGMRRFARCLVEALRGGDIVSLEGHLGAGKTYLVREVARALGYTKPVTSPTFVLQKLYELPEPCNGIELIIHYDVYRLESYEELRDIGFEEVPPTAVTFVEWGRKFIEHFPQSAIRVGIAALTHSQRLVVMDIPEQRMNDFAVGLRTQEFMPELSGLNDISSELFES